MSAIFLKLLNLSITAGWLILAVILVRFLLKKAPKWISCVLWALVAVRLICPFSLKSALSLIPSSETVPDNIEMMQKPAIDSGIPIVNEAVNPVIEGSFTPDPAESVNPLQTAVSVCSIVWLAGMAAMLLYALLSSVRLKRSVGASVPAGGNIFVCDEVQSPFILGIARPMIFIPSSLSGRALDCVITHEKTHIRRHDHWWKPLGYLLLSIYWFNPLCWIAYVLLCRDIEMACDEKVIRNMEKDGIAEYSQALLDCSFPRKRIAVCPLAFGEVGVKERVRSVLNYKKPAFWIIIASVLACIVVGICFLTDPKDREPDTSLLNYENAGSVLSDRTYVDAIFCPPVDKNEDGQISLGYVKGIELAEYLDQVSWQEWKAPEEGLSSPGSVEFFIDTDCQITVYRKPRRAKVTYKEKVRYYKTHGGDYEGAVKLYHTRNAEPAVMKWFDSFNEDNMIWDGSREISPEEFPGVTFRWEPEKLEAVTEKETVTLCTGMPIWSVFFCDLNGDGKPELCLTVSFGSGMIDNRIEVIDYANHAFYELSDRGRYDYSLSLRMNGQLCAEKRAYMQDEILASGQLVLREIMGIDGNVMSSLMIEEGDPEEADQEEETEDLFSLEEGRYVLEKTLHSEEIFRFNKLFS